MSRGKVVVGMSGGVDSAAAAYLLREAGYEVVGVTLRTWESGSSRCCEIDLARSTASRLGIKYFPWNVVQAFREYVVQPFMDEYVNGRTPNPCVECNPHVKWAGLSHVADVLQADFIATGHYAAIASMENGRLAIKKAVDERKDQSYMLYRLTQKQLARTLFPLGDMTKEQVRRLAVEAGIAPENQSESQEICFVSEGSYADYIEKAKGAFSKGNFVDESGKIVGEHRGIAHYTVGQRKSLGLALGYPAYVKTIRAKTNEIVVGSEAALYRDEIFCDRLAFMGIGEIEAQPVRALVKTRYHHAGAWAELIRTGEDRVQISFEQPVRAVSPGQSAVFYDAGGCVLGGGRIIE